jgi:hypothetical protein
MKIFFTLLFFILFSPIWGQKFSYKWAENDLDKKESIRPDFVFTKKDGNFIVVSLKVNADAGKQKIAINEYNGALKKVKSVSDVRFKNKAGEDIDIYQSMSIKGNHYLLGNKYDSKSNVFKLYAFQLDNNLKSSGNPIELLTFFAEKERKIPKLSFRFCATTLSAAFLPCVKRVKLSEIGLSTLSSNPPYKFLPIITKLRTM